MAWSLSTTSSSDSPVHRSTAGSDETDPFWEASDDLLHWIWSWKVQFGRLRDSTKQDGAGSTPIEIRRSFSRTSLDEHLLTVTGAHLVRALAQYEEIEPDVGPNEKHREALTLLRNLYEHWDEQREYARDPSKEKKRSAKLFAEAFPDGRPFSIAYAATDWLLGGVVPLFELTKSIEELERAVLGVEDERRAGDADQS